MSAAVVPLDTLAGEINARLDRAHRRTGKAARDHRLAAGLLLNEARSRIPTGQWQDWCKTSVNRSVGEIRRLTNEANDVGGRNLVPVAAAALAVRKSHLPAVEKRAVIDSLFGSPELLRLASDASDPRDVRGGLGLALAPIQNTVRRLREIEKSMGSMGKVCPDHHLEAMVAQYTALLGYAREIAFDLLRYTGSGQMTDTTARARVAEIPDD